MSDSPLDDLCDELGIGQRVPGPMGSISGKPRTNPYMLGKYGKHGAAVELLAQLAKPVMSFHGDQPLTAIFHNNEELRFAKVQPLDWSTTAAINEIPPPSKEKLLERMTKMIREMPPPGELAERIDMGKDALAELHRQTLIAPTSVPGPPVFSGIRVVLSTTLDDDQWVAYDRHGNVLAQGRIPLVTFPIPDPWAAARPSPTP